MNDFWPKGQILFKTADFGRIRNESKRQIIISLNLSKTYIENGVLRSKGHVFSNLFHEAISNKIRV